MHLNMFIRILDILADTACCQQCTVRMMYFLCDCHLIYINRDKRPGKVACKSYILLINIKFTVKKKQKKQKNTPQPSASLSLSCVCGVLTDLTDSQWRRASPQLSTHSILLNSDWCTTTWCPLSLTESHKTEISQVKKMFETLITNLLTVFIEKLTNNYKASVCRVLCYLVGLIALPSPR